MNLTDSQKNCYTIKKVTNIPQILTDEFKLNTIGNMICKDLIETEIVFFAKHYHIGNRPEEYLVSASVCFKGEKFYITTGRGNFTKVIRDFKKTLNNTREILFFNNPPKEELLNWGSVMWADKYYFEHQRGWECTFSEVRTKVSQMLTETSEAKGLLEQINKLAISEIKEFTK